MRKFVVVVVVVVVWQSLLLLLLVLFGLPTEIDGWGKDGHELVGNLAYRLLSKKTKATVDKILVNHPLISNKNRTINTTNTTITITPTTTTISSTNTPLGEVADWADQVRIHKGYHWSGLLHYIDVHDDDVNGGCPVVTWEQKRGCHFQYDRDCLSDACVAGAIVNYTNHLADWYHRWKQRQQQQQQKQENPSTPTDLLFAFNNNRRLRGSAALLTPYRLSWWWRMTDQVDPTGTSSSSPQNTTTITTTTPTTTTPTNLIQESLMFLTHFVGDIHQPLHSGRKSDRGGNNIPVTFKVPSHYYDYHRRRRHLQEEQSSSSHHDNHHHHHQELHAVWDSSIILRAIHTEYEHNRDDLERDLWNYIDKAKKSGRIKEWLECPDTSDVACTTKWAEESWANALKWAYANSDGISEVRAGMTLTDDYYYTRWPRIQHYIAVAGVRLAVALEMVLGGTEQVHA